ncbi:hypothetical protein GQ54DRAFT_304177 [Martensiomyces pterosporus]|nr:hypothetical protein GQ54DRAFT_304177 [Martensiomyces pterosporus]
MDLNFQALYTRSQELLVSVKQQHPQHPHPHQHRHQIGNRQATALSNNRSCQPIAPVPRHHRRRSSSASTFVADIPQLPSPPPSPMHESTLLQFHHTLHLPKPHAAAATACSAGSLSPSSSLCSTTLLDRAHNAQLATFALPAAATAATVSTTKAMAIERRRDSKLLGLVSDDGESDRDTDDEYDEWDALAFDNTYIAGLPRWEEGVFELEMGRPAGCPLGKLDPSSLLFGSTGKPQPWSIRPKHELSPLRVQIQAIDDDDNEFCLM